MKLATYSPTRGVPSIAVVSPPRALPVIPCDPTPPAPALAALVAFGPPVDVAQLRSPEERFRCVPLASVIAARDCLKRQTIACGAMDPEERTSTGGARSWAGGGGGSSLRAQFSRCRDCELGRAVAKRLAS